MSEFFKLVTFLTISFIICYLSIILESDFVNGFADDFIALLTTLLAINIASSSLIAGKLKELNIQTGHKFEKTTKELKRSLTIQLILIAISFIVLLVKSSKMISGIIGFNNLEIITNTITIGVFIYYLDTIKDLGMALFSLLNFNDE